MNKHNFKQIKNDLSAFFLSNEIINNFKRQPVIKETVEKKKNIIAQDNIFFPNEKDQLFWCFY